MVQVQNLLASARTDGWSRRAWELESEVVQFRSDAQVRNQAVAILAGLDAAVSKKLPESAAQSIRFDPQGRRLLMGTLVPNRQAPAIAKLWDSESDRFEELQGAGFGPVAFAQDAAPLQLTLDPAQNQLALIDLSTGREQRLSPVNGGCCYRSAVFSPDGTYILFAFQDRSKGADSKTELYYFPLDGSAAAAPLRLPLGFFTDIRENILFALRPPGP